MEKIEIKGSLRESTGKVASKKLRKEDLVPCVIYGGEKNIHFSTIENDLRHLIFTPHVYLVDINIDGNMHLAILQDIQLHPVSDRILHLDFLLVAEDKPVVIEVPIKLTGLAKGVKEGGKLQLIMRKLKIKALPANLPDVLEINIDNLGIGQVIKVSELNFENIQVLNPASSVIAGVKATRAAKETATVAS